METTSQLINQGIAGISQAAEAAIPNQRTLSKIIRRKWNKRRTVPVDPNTIEELDIPPDYTIYEHQSGFQETFSFTGDRMPTTRY